MSIVVCLQNKTVFRVFGVSLLCGSILRFGADLHSVINSRVLFCVFKSYTTSAFYAWHFWLLKELIIAVYILIHIHLLHCAM